MRHVLVRWLMNGCVLLGRLLAVLLPKSWLYGLGRIAAHVIVKCCRGVRGNLLANSRYLLPAGTTERARVAHAVSVVTNFTRLFIGMLRAPRDYPDRADLQARMVGREHGEHVLSLGRGAICVTLHLGNYELGTVLSDRFQPAAVVYRPDPFRLIEGLRSRTREHAQVAEITTDRPLFGVEVLDYVRRGGAVFVAGDIGFGGEEVGASWPFLGGEARFHTWPVRLSLTSGAPILPAFAVLDPHSGEHRLHLEPPILPDASDDVTSIMTRLLRIYEHWVREHPDQWLILHRYWDASSPAH